MRHCRQDGWIGAFDTDLAMAKGEGPLDGYVIQVSVLLGSAHGLAMAWSWHGHGLAMAKKTMGLIFLGGGRNSNPLGHGLAMAKHTWLLFLGGG